MPRVRSPTLNTRRRHRRRHRLLPFVALFLISMAPTVSLRAAPLAASFGDTFARHRFVVGERTPIVMT